MTEPISSLQEEAALRWNFLDRETDACAVVTERMEIVYTNGPAADLLPENAFGKRCFEVIPVADEECAWHCPTLQAVAEATDLVYCEETVCTDSGPTVCLGLIVIPLPTKPDCSSRALLMLRSKPDGVEQEAYQKELMGDADKLRERIEQHLLTI